VSVLGKERLFLAVALDEETRALVAAHIAAHGGGEWPGRLVEPSNWHLTLRFLGWSTEVQRDRILRHLDEATLPEPFRIRFAGLGAFPKPRRATVLWIGIPVGVDPLERVASICEEAAVGAGFAPEERPFHPHLTVSRVRPAVDATALVEGLPPLDLVMAVDAVTLFRSHLSRGGAAYEAVDTVAL
jgi:2'-5' RNA ligase